MATVIGRSLDEINKKSKELNNTIKSLTQENKELDKSLKYDANPLEVLNKRAKNTQSSIDMLTERIELLKEKQKDYQQQLEQGTIKQSTYDKLSLDIQKAETQLQQLNQELKKTNDTINMLPAKKFKEIGDNISKVGSSLKGLSITAGATLTGLTALSLKTVSNTAELQDYADRLGITAEALQRYDYIAMQSGVETEQLIKSVAKARDAIGTSLSGASNTATQALEKLFGGIANVPTDAESGFNAIIEQLSKIDDSTMQAYYANEIFGEKLATNLIPMINNGSEKLARFNEEFERIGYLSNEQVQALADFDDEMNIIKSSFKQTGAEVTVAFLPVMERIANVFQEKIVPAFKKVGDFLGGLSEKTLTFAVGLLALLTVLSPLLIIGGKIVSGVGNLIGLIPKLSGLLTGLSAHPIIAILGVVAGILMLLYTTNEEFRESINKLFSVLSKALAPILQIIGDLFTDIFSLITPIIQMLAEGLVPVIQMVTAVLEPLVELMEKSIKFTQKIKDAGLSLLGKGWLWGKESKSSYSYTPTSTISDYTLPDTSGYYNQSSSVISQDTYNIHVEQNASGNLDYDVNELADAVARQFIVKKQASGR